MNLTRDDVTILNTNAPGRWRGDAWLIRIGEQHYVVSAVDLSVKIPGYRDSETMAFAADKSGEVTEWTELGFVPHKDHWACIDDLLAQQTEATR